MQSLLPAPRHGLKRLRALLLTLLVLLPWVPPAARASVAVKMDVEQLTQASQRVVLGRVLWSAARWDGQGHIVTRWRVSVLEDLKGAGTGELDVETPGGVVDGIGQWVPGTAPLHVGEDAVLFLERSGVAPQAHLVVGMAQGLWPVLDVERGAPQVVRRASRLSLRAPGATRSGTPVLLPDAGSTPIPYAQFSARIRAAVNP